MGTRQFTELEPEDTILGILAGRPWGVRADHIWQDMAWDYVKNPERRQEDFEFGPPSSKTMEIAFRRLVSEKSIEELPGEPRHFEATRQGHFRGQSPQQLIRAAIERSR